MRTHLVLSALLLLSSVALADTAVPSPSARFPSVLGAVERPAVVRLSLDGVRLLPRTTRSVAPPGVLSQLYWGAIKDDATWRALVAKDPRALGFVPTIDFSREAVVFVLHDTVGGGGLLAADSLARDGATNVLRLNMTVKPAMLDIAYESETVLFVRVARADLTRMQLVANGISLG